ncbi:uncharacterized protein K02A2.6-like [Xyrichtys novacula]|uniref:Uncharacterized protein K02A2.6-like n=1 Tax=Xyrichtys novacula TaxID=13765 RepID=A0AAV1FFF5_XYRNO|nr:uncharacterized protein K02A2.6-like [Xyrichtys novacula]
MGRKLRTTVPVLPSCLNPKWSNVKALRKKEQREREKQQKWFNDRHRARNMASLNPGDRVWVTDMKEKGTVTAGADTTRSYIIDTLQRESAAQLKSFRHLAWGRRWT